MHPQSSSTPTAAWRFWLPMLLQSLLILAVPLQSAVTYTTGRTVTLGTVPVDPYDLLRGYSQTLRYEISNFDVLEALPGGNTVIKTAPDGEVLSDAPTGCATTVFYVVLAQPQQVTSPPTPWQPVRVSCDLPTSLPSHQVALRGQFGTWQAVYGLERYYMPEHQRQDLNDQIRNAQRLAKQAFVVNIKVDHQGNSVPDSLWIRDQKYRF